MKIPRRISKRIVCTVATLVIVALLILCGGLFYLSRNLAPVTRWTLEKNLPSAKVDVQDVKVTGPGEITFTNFVIHDPLTGKELARLESGRIVFSLDDLAAGRIGEIHLENPSILVSPGWSGVLPTVPEKSGGAALRVRRILCDFGEIVFDGAKDGKPDVRANFSFDWKNFTPESEEPLDLTLWDVRATAQGFVDPFLVLDLVRLQGTPFEMFKNFELRSLGIQGGVLAAGRALEEVARLPKQTASGPSTMWKIGAVDIRGLKTVLGNDPWRTNTNAAFTINTTLRNLTPAEITETLGATRQEVEISDLVIPSPNDPFTRILSLRSVFVRFTLGGILARKLDDVTVLHPVLHIGEDFFAYMEEAKKSLATDSEKSTPGWRIGRLEVKFGNIVIGSGGRKEYGLPLNFRTTAENVALDDLATLTFKGSLEIPSQNYAFPAYQIELSTEPGSLQFSYPTEKAMTNVVGTVRIKNLRWRQFQGSDSWITATFDRKGINGFFGGKLYNGTIAGGFSFFFDDKSPWIGWLSGTRLDLGDLTDMIAPQNFHMTGPLDFTTQVHAESKSIRRLRGSMQTKAPGSMHIGKIDNLLASLPSDWTSLKRDSMRIALEALRDFQYGNGSGDFWFADGQGIFDLKLHGPLGSRTFQTVLHSDDSRSSPWQPTFPR